MKTYSLLACSLALAQTLFGQLTVCGSGCNYSTLGAAVMDPGIQNCTVSAITITAGYVSTDPSVINMPNRQCDNTLVIQSSATKQLPRSSYRVSPSTLANYSNILATVTTADINNPVLNLGNVTNGAAGYQITAVDLVGNTILMNNTAANIGQLSVGTGMYCRDYGNGISNGQGIDPTQSPQPGLPQPLERFTEYFIVSLTSVDPSDVKVQFSTAPGGAPLTMLTADGISVPGNYVYWQPSCALAQAASNISFRGIWFKPPDPNIQGTATASGTTLTNSTGLGFDKNYVYPGPLEYDHNLLFNGQAVTFSTGAGCTNNICQTATIVQNVGTVSSPAPYILYRNYAGPIVQIGGQEYTWSSKPTNITFEQDFIGGDPTWRDRSVQTAMGIDGVNVTVEDSWLESMYYNNGNEGKCFSMLAANNVALKNNECDAAGAFLLTGGAIGDIPLANSQNVQILNNYILTPGWMFYQASNRAWGAPTIPPTCYYGPDGTGGQFVIMTDPVTIAGGSVYTCQSNGTYALDTNATYRPTDYRYKARTEFKDVIGLQEIGNISIGQISGQDGNQGFFALTHTEQSQFNNGGQSYYTHQNIVVKDNWIDRTWGTAALVGQVAPNIAPSPWTITNVVATAANDLTTTLSSSIPPSSYWGNCPCPFFTGVVGSGTLEAMNGRMTCVSSVGTATLDGTANGTAGCGKPFQFPASGTYSSGGTMTAVTWPTSDSVVFTNNVATRIGDPALTIFQPGAFSSTAQPFSLRMFQSHSGGPIVSHNTFRGASSSATAYGETFETTLSYGGSPFANFPNNEAILNNNIVWQGSSGYSKGSFNVDCTSQGFGGFFQNSAAFAYNVGYGGGAAWPSAGSGCSDPTHLKTAAGDSAVTFVGADQSVLGNSALGAMSPYSASAASPTMVSNDGTDLGADVAEIAAETSGVITGTPPFRRIAALNWDLGSSGAILDVQGQLSWTVTIYRAPARIAANQVAQAADTCAGCIVDGVRRQIVVSGLSPNTVYYYLATDGTKTLVGNFQTLAAGSGTYNFDVSGTAVRYSSSPSMSGALSAPNGTVPVGAGSVIYVDHGSGTAVTALTAP